MTPEGKVKQIVRIFLHSRRVYPAAGKEWDSKILGLGWYYMPVQNGMGVTGIHDFIGCYKGRFFSIETKAIGKDLTENQIGRRREIELAGGHTFVVREAADLQSLDDWMRML